MLTRRVSGEARRTALARQIAAVANRDVSRRTFLRRSGLAAGGLAGLGALDLRLVRQAHAKTVYQEGAIERQKTVCPFCAVGCSIWAEVKNGVWVGQEPVFESPVNMGTHCAKGAATRELAIGERRLSS